MTHLRERTLDQANHCETVAETRLSRMAASTFRVWRVLPDGKAQDEGAPILRTLAEVERQIAGPHNYGETLLVLETATVSDAQTLHTYHIRRGKWNGQYFGHLKAYPHTADKLFSVRVKGFDPVEPWRCEPGADRLGLTGVITQSTFGQEAGRG